MPEPHVHQSATTLPDWYSQRYDEEGDTTWIPVLHRSWTFERGRDPYMEEYVAERTRGQARAAAASEWGESFTSTGCRKVWMRQTEPTLDQELNGWTWECDKDEDGAMPYWRVDYAPPKRCSRCSNIVRRCTCEAAS